MKCSHCFTPAKTAHSGGREMLAYRYRDYKCDQCGRKFKTGEFRTHGLDCQEAALIIRAMSKLSPESRRGILEGIGWKP